MATIFKVKASENYDVTYIDSFAFLNFGFSEKRSFLERILHCMKSSVRIHCIALKIKKDWRKKQST